MEFPPFMYNSRTLNAHFHGFSKIQTDGVLHFLKSSSRSLDFLKSSLRRHECQEPSMKTHLNSAILPKYQSSQLTEHDL